MCQSDKDNCKCGGDCAEEGGCGCITRCNNPTLARHFAESENIVWAWGKRSNQKATALYLVRACVARYGGTVDVDIATNTLDIRFPDSVSKEKEAECALEVERIMDRAGYDLSSTN